MGSDRRHYARLDSYIRQIGDRVVYLHRSNPTHPLHSTYLRACDRCIYAYLVLMTVLVVAHLTGMSVLASIGLVVASFVLAAVVLHLTFNFLEWVTVIALNIYGWFKGY